MGGNHKKGEVQGQTRQHARLLHLLGVEQVIAGVNKMDSTKPKPYSEDRFKEINKEVKKMLTKIGFKTKKIPFVPMSGFQGDNLIEESQNMDWYKGFKVKQKKKEVEGKTLLDALNKVRSSPDQTSSSLQLVFLENASPSKCTTRPSTKLDQVTTLVLTSRDFQKRTCLKLETSCRLKTQMEMMIHQKLLKLSELPSLSKITLDN